MRETVGSLVEKKAALAPDAPVLFAPGREPLTYRALERILHDVRAFLRQAGIGTTDRVVAVLPDDPIAAMCFYAVSASAAYTPLSPELRKDEFVDLFTRLDPKCAFIARGLDTDAWDAASELGVPTISLVSHRRGILGFELDGGEAARCDASKFSGPDEIAVILATSGTTSREKLVPLTHSQLSADSRGRAAFLRLTPDDCGLIGSAPYYASAVKFGWLPVLASGSALVWGSPFEPGAFCRLLQEFRPTWATASAAALIALSDHLEHETIAAETDQLRLIRSSMASLDGVHLDRLQRALGAPVIECYGATEVGVIAANPLPPGVRKLGSVGFPLHNEVRIFDATGRSLPPGREGEVVVRGASVFDGYLDDPAATRAAFWREWYRTGDTGRVDREGYLFLTGRLKEVMSRGGLKIAPLAVDAILERHPCVHKAATFSVPHPTLGEEVAAAVSLRAGSDATADSLLAFCRQHTTVAKSPKKIVFMEEIPTDPTGKIRRRELAREFALYQTERDRGTEIDERSLHVEMVAHVWSTTLGVSEPDVDEDFFVAGGDSLRAATLLGEVNRVLGLDLSLDIMLSGATTIRGIAHRVDERVYGRRADGRAPTAAPTIAKILKRGKLEPWFALPGVGGRAVGLIPLARSLADGRPVYAVQSTGLDGKSRPLESLEEIARQHVSEIRNVQTRGPYFLFGACFGAVVAFEIARQLALDDHRVASLVLLDPPAPRFDAAGRRKARPPRRRSPVWGFVEGRMRNDLEVLRALDWSDRPAHVARRVRTLLQRLRSPGALRNGRRELRARRVEAANSRALARYVPAPVTCPTALLLSSERYQVFQQSNRRDWLEHMKGLMNVVKVPGHDSGAALVPPHVDVLANAIRGISQRSEGHASSSLATPSDNGTE